jgi:hypothetical protein
LTRHTTAAVVAAAADNKITVAETPTTLVIDDAGSYVAAFGTCTGDGASRATCPLPPARSPVWVDGDDGDDEITDCKVWLRLLKGRKAYATGRTTVRKGRNATVKLELNVLGRKAFKRTRTIKLTVMGQTTYGNEKKLGTIKLKRR